jgi:hypothetical protein
MKAGAIPGFHLTFFPHLFFHLLLAEYLFLAAPLFFIAILLALPLRIFCARAK